MLRSSDRQALSKFGQLSAAGILKFVMSASQDTICKVTKNPEITKVNVVDFLDEKVYV